MKQLTAVFTITALTAFAPAMAEVNAISVSAPTDSELAFAIGDNQNLQAIVMTDEQMQETEGAAIALAPLLLLGTGGGAIGAWGNHAHSYYNTGKPASVSNTLKATGSGMATGLSMYGGLNAIKAVRSGKEISIGKNLRIAPFGNNTSNPIGKYPHYHRRVVDENGVTKAGQGIGRHRPWESRHHDKTWKDRF